VWVRWPPFARSADQLHGIVAGDRGTAVAVPGAARRNVERSMDEEAAMATDRGGASRKRAGKTRPDASARPKPRRAARRPEAGGVPAAGEIVPSLDERIEHTETTPALTGGDLDADWPRAISSGEEAVGGSVATPDQDVVDELGRALGVEQSPDAELRTSGEILKERDRHYWHLERDAADREES
jgi:hypothetical protein